MRLTLLATSCLLLIGRVQIAVGPAAQLREPTILDLTTSARGPRISLGVPGQQVGGMPGQETSTYQLPLNLLILGIQMNGSSLRVHLQVTNTGRSAFPVPSC